MGMMSTDGYMRGNRLRSKSYEDQPERTGHKLRAISYEEADNLYGVTSADSTEFMSAVNRLGEKHGF
jgi:hypothetical protein